MYNNSEAGRRQQRPSSVGEEDELEDDLVLEAAVQIFVWEDDGVQNDHLGGNRHVTT